MIANPCIVSSVGTVCLAEQSVSVRAAILPSLLRPHLQRLFLLR
jgi:hypothetical protein